MKIRIINGPNLNLLGKREPEKYGNQSFEDYLGLLKSKFEMLELDFFQSNVEGEIINSIHSSEGVYDGIILNAAGYTHTSVAIRDAISSIDIPVVEVHITNIYAREDFRHVSLISPVCKGTITGFGLESYRLGIIALEGILSR